MQTATVTTQGRFAIPAEIHLKHGIKPRSWVGIEKRGRVLTMRSRLIVTKKNHSEQIAPHTD